MKRTLILLLFILFPFFVQSQNQTEAEPAKFKTRAHIILDFVNNFSGGIEKGNKVIALADLSMDYSPQKGIFKNTSFNAHLLKTAGEPPSEHLIGDIQVASNIEGHANRFIYALYFKQKMGNFTLSAGLHDLNTEFMFSNHAADFINSSFGIAPAISLNIPVSIFPVTTLGGYIAYSIKNLDISAGLYNLNHHFAEEESFRFENHLFQQGYLGLTEIRYRLHSGNQLIGEYKIGAMVKKCEPQAEVDHPTICNNEKNHGLYFVGDQLIKRTLSGKKLNAFIQWGLTPEKNNFASAYWGTGLTLQDFYSEFLPEKIGLAVGSVKLKKTEDGLYTDSKEFETVIELTASFSLLNKISFQPDLQYIINPSGKYENAFVFLFRLQADLL